MGTTGSDPRPRWSRHGSIGTVVDSTRNNRAGTDPIRHPIDPAAAVRGRFDAAALLALWFLRSAAPALLIGSLIYAWLATDNKFESIPEMTSPGQAVRALLSPFAGVAVAIILRFLVGIAALALAYPLSRRETGSSIGPARRRRPFQIWADRLHLIRAYRSLRWTSTVRQLAATRLGRHGRILAWSGPALLITDIVLIFALLVVVYLNPRS